MKKTNREYYLLRRDEILAANKARRLADPVWRRKRNAAVVKANTKRREKIWTLIRRLKRVPCKDCRRRYAHWIMDFDHVRGKKLFSLGKAGYRTVAEILKEAAKCEIVCSNCHRDRTYKRRLEKLK